MAQLNNAVLVYDEMARPGVAKVIAPDLIIIIHDHWELDSFLRHRVFYPGDVFFVIDTRYMHADDDEPVLSILIVNLFNVRHRLCAEWAIEGPEINEHHLAAELFQLEGCRVDPRVAGLQFRRFLTNEGVLRMLSPNRRGRKQEHYEYRSTKHQRPPSP